MKVIWYLLRHFQPRARNFFSTDISTFDLYNFINSFVDINVVITDVNITSYNFFLYSERKFTEFWPRQGYAGSLIWWSRVLAVSAPESQGPSSLRKLCAQSGYRSCACAVLARPPASSPPGSPFPLRDTHKGRSQRNDLTDALALHTAILEASAHRCGAFVVLPREPCVREAEKKEREKKTRGCLTGKNLRNVYFRSGAHVVRFDVRVCNNRSREDEIARRAR